MSLYQKLDNKLKNEIYTFSFEAIGTVWEIGFLPNLSKFRDIEGYENHIISIVNDFDKKYSRFRTDSILYSLKDKLGKFKVGEEFVKILQYYRELYYSTSGFFSPFIGVVLDYLGYNNEYSFNNNQPSKLKIPSFDETIKFIDSETIFLLKKVSLDFGALGKGYLIDKIYSSLIDLNINYFYVNGGGDIRFYSNIEDKILNVALEHPFENDKFIGIYPLPSSKSICGSSILKRAWLDKNHIIDIKLMNSISNEIVASFVVADEAWIADALATICLLPKSDTYNFNYEFETLIIYSDLSCRYTDGFKKAIF